MNSKKEEIFSILNKEYPRSKTALIYTTPWQMLVATILSAQCTDARVNQITEVLFKDHPDVKDYSDMSQSSLIKYIKSAGFYKNKSKNVLAAAKMIQKDFNSEVPRTMAEMIKIPGVARKTANVVLGNAYNVTEGVAVDTHVKRLSFRLGFSKETNPEKIEKDLMKQFDRKKWYKLTHVLIDHGRKICKAITPACSKCEVSKLCPKNGVKKSC
ncbi:endonuclease III [Elusimicrobiota bacterium]